MSRLSSSLADWFAISYEPLSGAFPEAASPLCTFRPPLLETFVWQLPKVAALEMIVEFRCRIPLAGVEGSTHSVALRARQFATVVITSHHLCRVAPSVGRQSLGNIWELTTRLENHAAQRCRQSSNPGGEMEEGHLTSAW